MKLTDHVEHIRQRIDKSFRNRLGRMGITINAIQNVETVPLEYREERQRIDVIREVFIAETGSVEDAYEKLVEEFTFTLFNRLAALKVMEAHTLHPEIVTRRSHHGDRSFSHFLWLEENPEGRNEEQEGLMRFMEYKFDELASDIPLFSTKHPYHLFPTTIELNSILHAFNQVESDEQVESDIWKSDDVLGWLYESYNLIKKKNHKDSNLKIEFNDVSLRSQNYTPHWVIKFLVDNSLGKLYLEMFPDSEIKNKYKIANAPKSQIRERKPLTDIRLIDPATGSGNFLLYGFDFFLDLYTDQIDNYGADYDESKLPELIINHNLHGVDLDDRAVQLAQLGLYIKAKRKKRTAKIENFNIVSSDFFLPEYAEVRHLFENGEKLSSELEDIVIDIWADLQQAHKFGSLIRLEEKFASHLQKLEEQFSKPQLDLFEYPTLERYNNFRESFFVSLKNAIAHNTEKQGLTFLNTKTSDAITFLQILTQKYDVAVANPPYTDSSDFGSELKAFVNDNYKKPYKFNTNLYATFIKRCYELIDEKGKMALIHPLTFMYIKTFEDVRKFIIDKLYINVFVDYGLSNLFGQVMVDPAFYVLEKEKTTKTAWFISLDQYTRTPQEKYKKDYCLDSLSDYLEAKKNKHNYSIEQSKLKIINGWPFIYWISDGFREKFKGLSLSKVADIRAGIQTSNNNRFLRFWWEVENKDIINDKNKDRNKKRWAIYSKGGPYNKWDGNLWSIIDWKNDGEYLQNYLQSVGQDLHAQDYYFTEGISYSASGSKGPSFRYLPDKCLFDIGGSSIFLTDKKPSVNYLLGLLNSKLTFYIIDCLNPTVNVQPQDLKRIPFVKPSGLQKNCISMLSTKNIEIKRHLNSYHIFETNFKSNALTFFLEISLRDRILAYLNFEITQFTLMLLNEAIINQQVFEIYALNSEDRQQVETKLGKSVGELSVLTEARDAFLSSIPVVNEITKEFIQNLTSSTFEEQEIQDIKQQFTSLYQSNNDLEEFCIRHQVNPINIWYWFRESKVLPQSRASEIALEFLADAFRTILMRDEDGIIPLVGLPGEPRLLERLEHHCLTQGFTSAQFMQLDGLLGRPINDYIEHQFFKNFSDHLNLFMYLPKTPFIWHLSSGSHQGFEAFIVIYKWNRDSLYKLKTQYLSKRTESLEYRQIQLVDSNTAQSLNEKEIIRMQLLEIKEFTRKIDELIAEGYDPKLDDGVGKNIAPIQNKGMLHSEVLNKKQLEKYLKADW